MRALLPLAPAAVALVLFTTPASALDWGGIDPGATTMEAVRARYGPPTKVTTQKVENYDTAQWTYEGTNAPSGMKRMVLEFGLLKEGAFKPDLVRDMKLEPKPGIFDRQLILTGWGEPDAVKVDEQTQKFSIFFYQRGLAVYFEQDGMTPSLMLFTPPQAVASPAAAPPAPAPSKP